MMAKIKEHFLKFGPRRFVIMATVLLLVMDILNSWYLKLYWLKKDLSGFMVKQSIERSGNSVEYFSVSTIREMEAFLDNIFYFFIFLILINNIFFYFFYLRKKLWAQSYVLFYAFTAAIFSVTFLIDQAGLGTGWMLYNLLTIPLYVYLYLGVKVLKRETTDFIPADEKTAR